MYCEVQTEILIHLLRKASFRWVRESCGQSLASHRGSPSFKPEPVLAEYVVKKTDSELIFFAYLGFHLGLSLLRCSILILHLQRLS
jgi:hypothetical protein